MHSALKNVVSNEIDVKGVLQKIVLGEADAGIVYVTDGTPSVRFSVRGISIPAKSNITATYPIAVVKGTRHALLARAFTAYVLNEGQNMLRAAGFQVPGA
jgi:molybdate transport system substrate-binding protein